MPSMGDQWEDLLAFAPKEEVDAYARKQLKQALKEYTAKSGQHLARISYVMNSMRYLSFPVAAQEVEEPRDFQISFYKPELKMNWDFNLPVKGVHVGQKGMGWMKYFNYDPFSLKKWGDFQYAKKKTVMLRAFMEQFFVPESIKTASKTLGEEKERKYIPQLRMMDELWHDVHSGVIPFQIKVCIYTKQDRYTFSLNLVQGTLLQDFRAGKVSPKNLVRRKPMDSLLFDEVFASIDLPSLPRKVMRIAFESKNISVPEVSHIFGITTQMAENNLKSLDSRGIIKMVGRPPSQVFEIDMDGLASLQKQLKKDIEAVNGRYRN